MRKYLLGLVSGFVLAALAGVIVFFSAVRWGERRPDVPQGATLILSISGAIPEKPGLSLPWQDSSPLTVYDAWNVLRMAAADTRIQAVWLAPSGVDAGWAKLAEIRAGLLRFGQSGKLVAAYLRSPGAREYYLATAAGRIAAAPIDLINLKGLRAELSFYRGTLDKLGVVPEIEHVGRYKDAGDMLVRTSSTPETREVINSILDARFDDLVQAMSQARHQTPEQIRATLDEGPFLGAQAKERGLVDDLFFEDQFAESLAKQLGQKELKKVYASDYRRFPASRLGLEGRTRVAMLVAEGDILHSTGNALLDDEEIASTSFIQEIREVAKDDRYKGVILRVNSGGGDAIASDEILREIQLLSKKKPLVISMSDVAASGGYSIALSGDPILAYPQTITGSIGVIYGKFNLRGLYDKLGVTKETLTRGKHADLDSDYQPLTDEGRRKLRESLEGIYHSFVQQVAAARRKPYADIDQVAQGRAWLGSQSKSIGLVDEFGGIDRSIELLKQRMGCPPSEKLRVVLLPRQRSWIERLASGEWSHWREQIHAPASLQKRMPYSVEIR
jgi:protease IV